MLQICAPKLRVKIAYQKYAIIAECVIAWSAKKSAVVAIANFLSISRATSHVIPVEIEIRVSSYNRELEFPRDKQLVYLTNVQTSANWNIFFSSFFHIVRNAVMSDFRAFSCDSRLASIFSGRSKVQLKYVLNTGRFALERPTLDATEDAEDLDLNLDLDGWTLRNINNGE